MFTFVIRYVPVRFVVLNNIELKTCDVIGVIETIQENDVVNNYDLNVVVADVLVDMGILRKRGGSRNSVLYEKTERFDEFYDTFWNEFNEIY